jgi:hypothetical protein
VACNSIRSESIAEIPIIKKGTRKLSAEQAEAFIAKLKEPKVTRPRAEKTMSSAIKSHFRSEIEEPDVARILKAMLATGFIAVEAGEIVYAK